MSRFFISLTSCFLVTARHSSTGVRANTSSSICFSRSAFAAGCILLLSASLIVKVASSPSIAIVQ